MSVSLCSFNPNQIVWISKPNKVRLLNETNQKGHTKVLCLTVPSTPLICSSEDLMASWNKHLWMTSALTWNRSIFFTPVDWRSCSYDWRTCWIWKWVVHVSNMATLWLDCKTTWLGLGKHRGLDSVNQSVTLYAFIFALFMQHVNHKVLYKTKTIKAIETRVSFKPCNNVFYPSNNLKDILQASF